MLRQAVLPLASLPVWTTVNPGRVELELRRHPALRRPWDGVCANKAPAAVTNAKFLPALVAQFLDTVEGITEDGALSEATLVFCERFVELLSDLMSQLGTRRFFRLVLVDQHVIVRIHRSALWSRGDTRLFKQLVDVLAHYQDFEIDDQTGMALTLKQMEESHYQRIQVGCSPPSQAVACALAPPVVPFRLRCNAYRWCEPGECGGAGQGMYGACDG